LLDRQLELAEAAFTAAAAGGVAEAAFNLGVLLKDQPGRAAEAEAFYRQAAAGVAAAHLGLAGLLRKQRGRELDAEAAYQAAIAAGVDCHNDFGLLLGLQEGREAEAEEHYSLAMAKAADDPIPVANLAGLLLAIDRAGVGEQVLADAFRLAAATPIPGLRLGLWFYKLIHGPTEERTRALGALHLLLESGERAPGGNLSRNVAWARNHADSESEWIEQLAAVIADGRDPVVLDGWPAWRDSAPTP